TPVLAPFPITSAPFFRPLPVSLTTVLVPSPTFLTPDSTPFTTFLPTPSFLTSVVDLVSVVLVSVVSVCANPADTLAMERTDKAISFSPFFIVPSLRTSAPFWQIARISATNLTIYCLYFQHLRASRFQGDAHETSRHICCRRLSSE